MGIDDLSYSFLGKRKTGNLFTRYDDVNSEEQSLAAACDGGFSGFYWERLHDGHSFKKNIGGRRRRFSAHCFHERAICGFWRRKGAFAQLSEVFLVHSFREDGKMRTPVPRASCAGFPAGPILTRIRIIVPNLGEG